MWLDSEEREWLLGNMRKGITDALMLLRAATHANKNEHISAERRAEIVADHLERSISYLARFEVFGGQ